MRKLFTILFICTISSLTFAQVCTVSGIILRYQNNGSPLESSYAIDVGTDVYLFSSSSLIFKNMAECTPQNYTTLLTEKEYLKIKLDSIYQIYNEKFRPPSSEISKQYASIKSKYEKQKEAIYQAEQSIKVCQKNIIQPFLSKEKRLFENQLSFEESSTDILHTFVDSRSSELFRNVKYGHYSMLIVSGWHTASWKYTEMIIDKPTLLFRFLF